MWNLHLFVDTLLSNLLRQFVSSVELLINFWYLSKGIALSFFRYQNPMMKQAREKNDHVQTIVLMLLYQKLDFLWLSNDQLKFHCFSNCPSWLTFVDNA